MEGRRDAASATRATATGSATRRRPPGRRVPLPADHGRRHDLEDRPLRPPGDQLGRQRRWSTTTPRSTGRTTTSSAPPHHELVIYELHIGSFYAPDEDRSGHAPAGHGEARPPGEAGRQRGPDHAADGVRRRPLLGLQPGPHLRGGVDLRRPGRLQDLRPGGPQAGHRGDPRRGLQPLRAQRPGPVAVRRLERERQGRHLLLQRRPLPDPVGRHPARLRTRGGAPLHPRQRDVVAPRLPPRRPAVRHDALHPQRPRQRPRSARGLGADALDQPEPARAVPRAGSASPRTCSRTRGSARSATTAPRSTPSGTAPSCTRCGRWSSPPTTGPLDPGPVRRAGGALQRRRLPASGLHRVPRRGGQRPGPGAVRGRPGRPDRLVRPEAVDRWVPRWCSRPRGSR